MPTQAVFGIAAFVGMFVAWAVLPSLLRRRHAARAQVEEETSSN